MLSRRQICLMHQHHRYLADLWAYKICMRELHPLQVQAKLTRGGNTGGSPPNNSLLVGYTCYILCPMSGHLPPPSPPPPSTGWVMINLSSHLNSWKDEKRQRCECLMKCGTHIQKPMLERKDSLLSGGRLMPDHVNVQSDRHYRKMNPDYHPCMEWRVLYHPEGVYFAIMTSWVFMIPFITLLLTK